MSPEIAIAIKSVVGLFILWYLLFFHFRDYLIDAAREELFATRDELFNYVTSIGVAYEDEIHTFPRTLINRTIRFVHKLTFFRVVLSAATKQMHPKMYEDDSYAKWKARLQSLPINQQQQLQAILARGMRACAAQMVWRSPFLVPVAAIYKAGSTFSKSLFLPFKTATYEKIQLGLREQQIEEEEHRRGGDDTQRPTLAHV